MCYNIINLIFIIKCSLMNQNKITNNSEREIALYYLNTFANMVREPFLVLSPDLKITGVSPSFCKNFEVTKEQTVDQFIYDLGNGQWNIPELRRLLEQLLPDNKFFNDFEVSHNFPNIGLKTMLLNARQLDSTQYILLAIEDITLKKLVEKNLDDYTKNLEKSVDEKTIELKARIDELSIINKHVTGREIKMVELKKEISDMKKSAEEK